MGTEGYRHRRLAWSKAKKSLLGRSYTLTLRGVKVEAPCLYTIEDYEKIIGPDFTFIVVYPPQKVRVTVEALPSDETYKVKHPFYPAILRTVVRHYTKSDDYVYERDGKEWELPTNVGEPSWDGYKKNIYDRTFNIGGSAKLYYEETNIDTGERSTGVVFASAFVSYHLYSEDKGLTWNMEEIGRSSERGATIEGSALLGTATGEGTEHIVEINDADFPKGVDVISNLMQEE